MADTKHNGGRATKQRNVIMHDTADRPGSGTGFDLGALSVMPVTGEMPKPGMETVGEVTSQSAMPRPGEHMRSGQATMPRPSMHGGEAPQGSQHTQTTMPRPQQTTSASSTAPAMPRPGMQAQTAGHAQPPAPTGVQRESILPTAAAAEATAAAVRIMQTPRGEVHALVSTRAGAAPRVGFDYPATLRGSTAHFNVYYDTTSLPVSGPIIADAVLASCEWEYSMLQSYFDGLTPGGLPFNIIIAAGIGGAYHYGCGAVDLYCDGDTSATPDVDHTRMLVVAEEVEVFSAAQGAGWNCGASNG
ncbi:MAG: hypothetical protein ABI186_03875, partial [Candidatus Elarobacter sp.]